MKKNLIIFFFIFLSLAIHAQTKIAIKGGLNYSSALVKQQDYNTNISTKQPSSYIPGWGLGIMFDIPFEGKLHFTPSFSFNERGFAYNPLLGDTSKIETKIKYVDITPSFSINFKSGKKSSFVVFAGPQLGVALSGSEKDTQSGITTSNKIKISTETDYSLFDLGINSGIGFHTKRFLVECAFQFGLANINNNFSVNETPTPAKYFVNIKNKMLSLNIGYFLK